MSGSPLNRRAAIAGMTSAALPAAARAKAGFSRQGLAAMRTMLDGHVARGSAPGLVVLLDRGGETEVMTAGTKALGGGGPMRRDTIFRIASMTKLVTATAVMMLIEEGKVRLDESVDRLLPELANRRVLKRLDGPMDDTVPARRPITVEDLLSFRLGWGIMFGPPEWPLSKAIAELGIVGFGMPDSQAPFGPGRVDPQARDHAAVRPAWGAVDVHHGLRRPGCAGRPRRRQAPRRFRP